MWQVGRSAAGLLIGGLVVLAGASPAMPAEWSAEPSLSVREEFNDNILFTSAPHRAVWGSTVSPGLKFSVLSESVEVRGGALMNFTRFVGEKGLDTTEQYFQVESLYRTDKQAWGLSGGVTRDTTLTSELLETGLATIRLPRNQRTVNPSWQGSLSDRLSLRSSYQFTDVAYGGAGVLFDYQAHAPSAGVSYRLSERDTVEATTYYLTYAAPSANIRADSYGAQVGLSHLFSETLRGALSGGARLVSTELTAAGVTRNDRETAWLSEGTIEKQFETSVLRGRFGREINPSGAGFLVQVDRLSIAVEQEFTPAMKGSVSADAYWTSVLRTDITASDRRFYRVASEWRWQWSEWWFLDLSYSYAMLPSVGQTSAVGANATFIRLTYAPPKWAMSR